MDFGISDLPIAIQIAIFVGSALVILVAGTQLAFVSDRIADQTGFGEALTGAVLLGAATSLPGTITSVSTALQGFPSLAYSNAIGGIAAQSLFLVFADIAYRRVNLEHAAASIANIMNGVILITLLALMLAASAGPQITILGVHPVSIVVLIGYGYGLRLAQSASDRPMWKATRTAETHEDMPDEEAKKQPLGRSLAIFAICLFAVAFAGYLIAETATGFVGAAGLSQSLVGAVMTAVVTSLPELVTTIAAVRSGALQLAVGGIIGGNAFDTLFASFADAAYRDGSIYHAISRGDQVLTAIVIAMSAVLVLGMLRREKAGFGGIGFEGWIVPVLYAAGIAGLILVG